jgi:tRNA-dependent cyclodipeptide synthase
MANVVTSSKPSHPSAGHARTYKTKISSVAPTEMREDWCRLGNGFLGVSLQNEEFVPPKLQAMTEWLHRKFARNAVLVGDSIHRITLETVRDMPKTQSLDTAMRLGDDTVATIQGLPRGTETAILRCSDIQMRSDYADAREQHCTTFRRRRGVPQLCIGIQQTVPTAQRDGGRQNRKLEGTALMRVLPGRIRRVCLSRIRWI